MSDHIDYITPGIKLNTGASEKVMKRMMEERRRRVKRSGTDGKERRKKKAKCKPRAPTQALDDPMFKVTGLCSDEMTPQCVRGKIPSYLFWKHIANPNSPVSDSKRYQGNARE